MITVIKVPKLFKKVEKRYPLTTEGIAKMKADQVNAKLDKINKVTYIAVLLAMFGIGILTKEMLIILVANKGINGITSLMFR